MRLWFDLLVDLAVSLPTAWLREDTSQKSVVEPSPAGLPSFHMIEQPAIRRSAFLFGTLGTISAMLVLGLLARHAGHFPLRTPDPLAQSRGVTTDPWATGNSSGDGTGSTELIGTANSKSASQNTAEAAGTSITNLAKTPAPELFDEQERQRVIEGIAVILKQYYPNHAVADRLATSLQSGERWGSYKNINDPRAFAATLTRQLRRDSGDMHFNVEFSQLPISGQPSPFLTGPWYRAVMRQANCGIQDAKILPHNIGLIKLNSFPTPQVCADMETAAMNKVSKADALIIDLRDNSGGSPAMVQYLASWLFDRPVYMYNPRENSTAAMWTRSPVPESSLSHRPIYVLTSSRTYSAAEQFSYDLKMLHRATLIGETTAGAVDTGTFHRIDGHFGIGLRESTLPNPYATPDWSAVGVTPTVPTSSANALQTAEALAASSTSHNQ